MARIRNIKPDYFRHEALQDLEAAYPGAYIMLTYIALWCQCDANGNFPWKPRTLKLDILPFIPFDLAATMQILLDTGHIRQYTGHDGNTYGHIPTFRTHQRITGKEATEGEKYPKPTPGNNRETTGKQPDAQGEERNIGKEIREREGDNARAREGITEKEKTEEQPPPPQPSTGGGPPADPFTHCIQHINQWARTDDWQPLRDYAAGVGYDPATFGPVADEVKKFTAYWLDPKRHPDDRSAFQAEPARFFQERGRKWLLDAKNMNRPKRHPTPPQKPKYEPPPNHQRTNNGNAATVLHIGDITGKIITKI